MALKRKRCSVCKRLRYVSKFYINKKMRDGFYAMCKDCCSICNSKWHKANKNSVAVRNKKSWVELRQQILDAYGGKCACCGESTSKFLTIDHVKNDGNVHRKRLGTRKVYQWLRQQNFPKDGFQLLCYNCNMAKAHYGKCPHEDQNDNNC